MLIARLGHRCFRCNCRHWSASKDQQGRVLQLSFPEKKLDWKLPEDVLPWITGIVRTVDPNGVQRCELNIRSSAETLSMLTPSPRMPILFFLPSLLRLFFWKVSLRIPRLWPCANGAEGPGGALAYAALSEVETVFSNTVQSDGHRRVLAQLLQV